MNNYKDIYSSLITKATFGQVEEASKWYVDAERIAEQVATNLNTTLEVGATVVSAFSPRERWSVNVARAIAWSLGEQVTCLKNNLVMANNALTLGFGALKGLKTNAFAKAIAGDEDSYRYLVESIRRFPDMQNFKRMIGEAGFVQTKVEPILGGLVAIHSGWKV